MIHTHRILLLVVCISAIAMACEKEITIDLPPGELQVVIEGRVENGLPPVVFVSTTRGFFEPTSLDDFVALYLRDAVVTVNGIELQRVCTDEVPEELLPLFEEITGIAAAGLGGASLCGYIGTAAALLGVENTTYHLEVQALGRTASSVAHIPQILVPDSVWFRLWADSPQYGFVFANLTDPDTTGNAYRVFTRRTGPNLNSNPVDPTYYAPLGAAFADDFFNGQTIEVGFTRGQPANSSRPTDLGEGSRFFEIGDQFVFKFCSTTRPVYDFFRTYEAQIGASGSPFATPNNVITNIKGGLGVWAAYACVEDTVMAMP